MRIFDLHQFHIACVSGIVYPKHSMPDILIMEHGKPCDIACVGTLLMIFQVIHLNIIAYTDYLVDFQSISPAFRVYRHHLSASLGAVYAWVLAIAAPVVAAVGAAETAAPTVTIENFAASGSGLTPLSHRASPPRPRYHPHPQQGSRNPLSALQL